MITTFVIYNSIVFFSTLFVWLSNKTKSHVNGNIFKFIAFFIVFLPAAIRYYIAEDYVSYVSIFEKITNGEPFVIEPGFYFLVKLVAFLNCDVQWVFIITSFLIYFFLFKSYKYNRCAWLIHLSFLLMFYLETYSVIRASLALSIIMYGTNSFINERSFKKLFLIILFASLFHKSALLAVFVFVFSNNRFVSFFNKYKLNYLFIFILVLAFYYRYDIVGFIANSQFVYFMGYDVYLDSSVYSAPTELNTGFGVTIIFLFLILPLFFYDYIKVDRFVKFQYVLFIYFCSFSLSLSLAFFIFKRVNYIYYAGFFYSIYLLYNINSFFISRFFCIAFVVFYFFIFENSINVNRSDKCLGTRVSPYVTVFNKELDKSIKMPSQQCIELYGRDVK